MKESAKHRLTVRVLPALIAASFAGQGYAAGALEEVVITAQKREERLQDVPIAVTALSGSQLVNRGIEGLANLNSLAPNLMFRPNPSTNLVATVSIRGSVTGQPAIWMDPPVGIYVDGVYIGKAQGSVFDVIDVERIEVLRGPQGTLFGRNTEGGAVSFISRKPSGEFGGSAGFEVGNYGHTVWKLAMDLPKMGIASLNFGYRKENQDGWMSNNTSGVGGALGKRDKEAFRFAANFAFSPATTLDYKFDHSDINNTPPASTLYALSGWSGTFPSVFGGYLGGLIQNALTPYIVTNRPDTTSTQTGYPLYEKNKTDGHTLIFSHKFSDNNELKYIFATRKMEYHDSNSLSGAPMGSIAAPGVPPNNRWGTGMVYHRDTQYKQDSHELQWIGHTDRAHYVLGYYLFKDDGTTLGPQDFSLFGLPYVRDDYAVKTDAKAWFGQIDYKVTDALTATFGMRHTTETKSGWTHRYYTTSFNGPFLTDAAPGTIPMVSYAASWSANTPVVAVGYKLSEQTSLYARIARGFKSGGFNGELTNAAIIKTPFNPEKSLSFEMGVKATFLDNRARLNASVFQNKITDLHITQLIPGTSSSYVVNAGKATYQGIELEGAVILADGWTLQGGYGYLDTKFDEYIDNALNIPGRPLIDTASNRLAPYAPKHTLNLNLDGKLAQTSWGTLRGIVDYTYTAKVYLYAANKSLTAPNAGGSYVVGIDEVPAQMNINARLLLADVPVGGPGKADISLWVKNLTDEKKVIQKIDFGMYQTANWQEPRTYGLTFNYKW
ncbi:MAG: TonB-dependent receptor [Proteobacteria bacterium]|nr:TonB-dependent receptor [Pseudomonadota bacterium]HQR02784.1 TonB-dependent receptor [Rhodocyclaceae bacterium]